MFELMDNEAEGAVIKVVGVGGGGGNAVKNMLESGIEGVDYICANTDSQALQNTGVKTLIQLGSSLTKGLGAGANPEIGREAALEDRERIKELITGTDMLFITAGMGGGTGTGAAPVVAEMAKELNILTVAVVTTPFLFEGPKRMQAANSGIDELSKHVDSLITIPNQKLLTSLGKNISLLDAFKAANDVLLGAVQGIAELITRPGLINVDFADVRTVMSGMGVAMMGTGSAMGDERATKAAQEAISSPLLDDTDLNGARGILVNITAGMDMGINEFEEVGEVVREFAADDATVVVGTVIDIEMLDEIRVTLVATGLGMIEETATVTPIRQVQATKQKVVEKPKIKPPTRKLHLKPVVLDSSVKISSNVGIATRKSANNSDNRNNTYEKKTAFESNYLDIPAFLRNQAE